MEYAELQNPFKTGSQAHMMLAMYQLGPVSNVEWPHFGVLSWTRRNFEIRKAIQTQGFTLKKDKDHGRVTYSLAKLPPVKSWWQRLKDALKL